MPMIDLSNTPLPQISQRRSESHKGDYGRTLIVGGSLGMAGAPALAAMSCLRSGAGLVGIATPSCVQPTVAAYCPAYTTHALADDGERVTIQASQHLDHLIDGADAVAIGPGLGRSKAITQLVGQATTLATPLVVDADGLNALAERWSNKLRRIAPAAPLVLTPHAGEFERLSDKPLNDPNEDAERLDAATALVREIGGPETVLLLKGPRTVVTDGEHYAVNATGNPGMATGGSGDVLTGIIAALIGQGLSGFAAARIGAHVHGLAGDLAAAKLGQMSLIATDLVDNLPQAWQSLDASPS
ncbi:MAG: NAD(P)H-hydrate dehydratase [Planctomycetota bacterium]